LKDIPVQIWPNRYIDEGNEVVPHNRVSSGVELHRQFKLYPVK
jgi:hypothetical protein